jgi:hypothetical protein
VLAGQPSRNAATVPAARTSASVMEGELAGHSVDDHDALADR